MILYLDTCITSFDGRLNQAATREGLTVLMP
jgi:hypothetical protein